MGLQLGVSRLDERGPLKVAIVGAGLMGRWHAFTARQLGARIRLIADPDRRRAEALAARHSGCRWVASAEGAFDSGEVDAAHICSPVPTHVSLAQAAFAAGIHALVEKPLTATAEETRSLVDAARGHGVVLCPVHQLAFQRGVLRAAAVLPHLGPVTNVRMQIASAGGLLLPGVPPDAIIADILPHPISLVQALWPHADLVVERWAVHRPRPGEVLISGEHAGATLAISISMHARPTCFELDALCQLGALHLDLFHGYGTVRNGRASRLRKIARPFTDALDTLIAASFNLGARGLSREPAYPGLRSLVRHFYAAARSNLGAPISLDQVIAAAVARDRVLARMAFATPADAASS